MHAEAGRWFRERTFDVPATPARRGDVSVSVVIPARNEAATVGDVVARICAELRETGFVDEVVVIDSLSSDGTAAAARAAGADVHSVADIRPDLGVRAGKGEALWKSQFVTHGSVLVFVDADLTEWGTHFVTGLVAPFVRDPALCLVKGFYDRVLDDGSGARSTEGGRVTELVARPLLAARWPQLSAVVQPLAGEWAIRRDHFARLSVPVGYGVEFSTLVDTARDPGLDAIAQVDLGSRAHRHQNVHDLGVMAAEILAVADRRTGSGYADAVTLAQYDRATPGRWHEREVPVAERPPMKEVAPC
ncbi:glucosyl-3-phosphoglycerate synthase [Jatrophihabitans fulvus]